MSETAGEKKRGLYGRGLTVGDGTALCVALFSAVLVGCGRLGDGGFPRFLAQLSGDDALHKGYVHALNAITH